MTDRTSAADLAVIAALVARAGLPLDADQVAALLPAYRRERSLLDALRDAVDPSEELFAPIRPPASGGA